MPNGWTIIVGTPEEMKEALSSRDPQAFRLAIYRRLKGTGAMVDNVFFDRDGGTAYVLLHYADNADEAIVDEIESALESEVTTIYTAEEVIDRRGLAGS